MDVIQGSSVKFRNLHHMQCTFTVMPTALILALVDCPKSVPVGWEFFALIQTLYTFISTPKAHSVFLRMQKELRPDKQLQQLQQLSDTRWACRQGAVHAICCTFDSVFGTLEAIEDDNDRAKAMEARGLLLQIKCFKFVLSLVVFDRFTLMFQRSYRCPTEHSA